MSMSVYPDDPNDPTNPTLINAGNDNQSKPTLPHKELVI